MDCGGGTERPRLLVRGAELGAVAEGLFEVIPRDLVELLEVAPALLEPPGKAGMQLGSVRFRQRVVCSVANEQVPEGEGVLAGEHRSVRAQEVLAHQRQKLSRHVARIGRH
ncbi:MAG TPA: hypothetical protein VN970_01185, partial [Thermoanaerobaculia bacterium]|nr:hypothetical protein [Thermoanaerobaculia bacterium]